MRKTGRCLPLLGLTALLGCGGDDDASIEERVCDRLVECDVESNTSQCVQEARNTLNQLSASNRADAEEQASECLRQTECPGSLSCLLGGGTCEPGCDFCWNAPGSCSEKFNGDMLGCDCGDDCDFVDVDCN